VKAIIAGIVIAEAEKEDLVSIEATWYFPPAAVRAGSLQRCGTPYTCPWKGAARYYDVVVEGAEVSDGAWSYPDPRPSAIDLVGRDFSRYVAFDPGQVDIRE
jgi:uncharacterized protein (DUF427 family)